MHDAAPHRTMKQAIDEESKTPINLNHFLKCKNKR